MISPHPLARRGRQVGRVLLASADLKVIRVLRVLEAPLGPKVRTVKKAKMVSQDLRGIRASLGSAVLRGIPARQAPEVQRDRLDFLDLLDLLDLKVLMVNLAPRVTQDPLGRQVLAEAASRAEPFGTQLLEVSPLGK
jgi:hypothetical protein